MALHSLRQVSDRSATYVQILGVACSHVQGLVETHYGHLELEDVDTSDPKVA